MRIRSGIGALLSAVALGAMALPSAQAVTAADGAGDRASVVQPRASQQTFRNGQTKACLADRGAKTADNKFFKPTMVPSAGGVCNSADDTQRWYISEFGDGWFRMQNVHTRRCLDDSPNGLTLVASCWANSDTQYVNFQKWDSSSFGTGLGTRLQNRWSRSCLDDSERGIRTNLPCATHLSSRQSQLYQAWY